MIRNYIPGLMSAEIPLIQNQIVYQLVEKNFKKEVLENDLDVFVKFYKPTCIHCARIKEDWENTAKFFEKYKEKVRIAEFNLLYNNIKYLRIKSWPTIYLFKKGEKGIPMKFEGIRNKDNFIKFVLNNMNNKLNINKEEEIIINQNISKSQKIGRDSSINPYSFLSKKRKMNFYNFDDNISISTSHKEFSIFSNFEENKDKNKEKKEKDNFLDYITENDKNDDIYNLLENTKNLFTIKGNIIDTQYLQGDKHYFVFFNQKYDIPKISTKKYTFKIKLLTKCEWLAVGICDKKIVESNNFEYDIKKFGKKKNTGIYIINVNKLVWNCNNYKQCIKLNYKTLSKKDTVIECTLSPNDCELEFMLNNDFFIVLNDVRCFSSDVFSPFLIFLKNGTVQTTFKYE
jgi:thiol-disulfide isomerase/thioredoxin